MSRGIHGGKAFILACMFIVSGCSSSKIPTIPSPGTPGGGPSGASAPAPQPGNQQTIPSSGAAPARSTVGGGIPQALPTPAPAAQTAPSQPITDTVSSPPVVPPQLAPFFYLSYDDSASTAAVELTKFSLLQGQLPSRNWARPWEFFNYERFSTADPQSTGLFNVSMGLWKHAVEAVPPPCPTAGVCALLMPSSPLYELGVHISSPTIDRASRRNLALTLVVDVSGSMGEQVPATSEFRQPVDKMTLARLGLETLAKELKAGDVINLVTFTDTASTVLEGFRYDGVNLSPYLGAVRHLQALNSTNLNAGLEEGYRVALAHFDPARINRVVMLTDAYANVGEVDPHIIAGKTRINNAEGIYFSGLGFGADFNEAFLDVLTEAGKGAYYSVVTPYDARRAFSDRLMALVNVAARNVQFRLDFPADLNHQGSAAEQVSQDQSRVQTTNFSYNTSQFFLESFTSRSQGADGEGRFKLTIEYTHPETGARVSEVYEQTMLQILGRNTGAIQDAYLISLLTGLMRGDKVAALVRRELDTSLADHQSPLATEYRGLIEKWISLAGIGNQVPLPLPQPVPPILPGYCNGSVCVN